LFCQFQEGGDDGDFFVGRDEGEDFGVEAVDAGELMGAIGVVELAVDIGDFATLDGEMAVGAVAADGKGGGVVGGEVAGDEFVDAEIGEDVAVVNEEGFVTDEVGDVFDAAAGFEEVWLVEELQCHAAIALVAKGFLPLFMEVVGIDGDVENAGLGEVIEGMHREGAVEDGHEGFWHGVGEGAQAGSETGSKEEGFCHFKGKRRRNRALGKWGIGTAWFLIEWRLGRGILCSL
jgi:hypothetical protein